MKHLVIAWLAVTIGGCCSTHSKRLDELEKWRAVVDPEIYTIRRTSYETLITMIYETDRVVTSNWHDINALSNRVDRIERAFRIKPSSRQDLHAYPRVPSERQR